MSALLIHSLSECFANGRGKARATSGQMQSARSGRPRQLGIACARAPRCAMCRAPSVLRDRGAPRASDLAPHGGLTPGLEIRASSSGGCFPLANATSRLAVRLLAGGIAPRQLARLSLLLTRATRRYISCETGNAPARSARRGANWGQGKWPGRRQRWDERAQGEGNSNRTRVGGLGLQQRPAAVAW